GLARGLHADAIAGGERRGEVGGQRVQSRRRRDADRRDRVATFPQPPLRGALSPSSPGHPCHHDGRDATPTSGTLEPITLPCNRHTRNCLPPCPLLSTRGRRIR